jgi:hypothetical protein
MTDIPYNYHKYIDDVTKMRQRGAISSGEQIASPSSAGSRGLAKTTQFTKNSTQMKMGQNEGMTPLAESMTEIRNTLNRIDGVNAPTEETAPAEETVAKEDLDYRSEDILNKAGFDPADIDTYMKVFNDHGDTSDIDQMNMKEKVGLADCMSMVLNSHGIQNESYQPFPEGDEFDIEEDEDFEEVLGPLGFPEDETELFDAEYQGRKVPLNKPMRGDVKKFKVYVKDPKSGNVKKVNFGHGGTSAKRKTMRIRKSNPKARKSFRARHNCANPGPKTKARYWSCRKW